MEFRTSIHSETIYVPYTLTPRDYARCTFLGAHEFRAQGIVFRVQGLGLGFAPEGLLLRA